MEYVSELENIYRQQSLENALRYTATMFPGKVRFSSSLGQEDQVLTDIISTLAIPISIFTIDTGRLFSEAYDTLEKTRARYKLDIAVYFPQTETVQQMVSEHGVNLFYDSVDHRKKCCAIRKVEPLDRALQNADVWITGLRAAQTDLRKNTQVVEWLPLKKMYKINPLLHWSLEEVKDYLKKNSVPFNPLHDKGFPSIGCAPCTRAIQAGEDIRAGRWWWETTQKECGLHLVK